MQLEWVEAPPRPQGVKPTSREPWHSVSIVSEVQSCEAAAAVAERRYLSREAPRLPLKGCLRPDGCQCVYRHHADRRQPVARRAHDRIGLAKVPPVEQRQHPARRKSDAA